MSETYWKAQAKERRGWGWRSSTPETVRFLVNTKQVGECIVWTGASVWGYGKFFSKGGKSYRSHRFAYELFRGPIPDGLVLDHLCRNKLCINPTT